MFYAHDAASPTQIKGGDLVIHKAARRSNITLTTDSSGLNMEATDIDGKNLVSATLNALANKLIYTAYTTGERNLQGNVEIAEGLTASSASKRVETITFDEATGKGGYAYIPLIEPPPSQTTAEFTTGITGEETKDVEYMILDGQI